MKANKVSAKAAKAIQNEMYKEYFTPFAVLNWINKNKAKAIVIDGEETTIQEILTASGVTGKMSLNDMLNFVEGDFKQVCKLVKVPADAVANVHDLIPGYIAKRYTVIGSTLYELKPIKYSISEFFKSLADMQRLNAERSKKADALEKLFLKEEKKAQRKEEKAKAKEEEKISKKAAEYMELLRVSIPDASESVIQQIAYERAKQVA